MRIRAVLSLALTLALALPAVAGPRDEALRLAPPDFAVTFVVQDLRAHSNAVLESPFAAWFPTSALGKKFFASAPFKSVTDSSTPIFAALGITPADVFHDILGDAVVFAFTPAAPGGTPGERSVILVRPRKPELLAEVVGKVNDAQIQSKELKAVVPHKHAGEPYFERQKPEGPSDFYCFRGGVFALSQSEAEVKAVIDRDRTAPKEKSELVARMAKLGVADAAAVLLINPRPLDAEIAAKAKNAPPNERGFQTKLAEVWRATEAAAVYLALDAGAEAGLSLRFDPAKLPAGAKTWLAGERTPSALWGAIPDNALAAVAGRVKPNDLIDFLGSLNPDAQPSPRETIEQILGPIMGKDKLPLVLDALGPDWGAWVLPPAEGVGEAKEKLPVAVAAVKVQAGEKGAEAAKALLHSLEYGFQAARIAYNARHKEQIELREEKDGDAVVTSLAGSGLPTGFRPCFALKGGYLLLSTSPEAIKSFKPPAGEPKAGGDVPLARFNAAAARAYLTSHAAALAKLLTGAGDGNEQTLAEQLGGLAALLEPVDRVELLASGDATGLKLMLRVKTTKPLKK
jgi:hypothetical protein